MSSHHKKVARHAGRANQHARSLWNLRSPFARWLLPGCFVAFAGAGLSLFLFKNHSAAPAPPVSTVREADRQQVPLPAAVTPSNLSSGLTNQAETQTGEDRVVALVTEGNQLLAQGYYAQAAQQYQQAVRIEPEDEDLHYNLGIALAKLGKREEAKQHYAEALRIFPDYGDAHNNLGNLLMNENKLDEAIEHFQAAIKNMPENASFHNNLGTAFGRQGRVAEASGEFAEAINRNPNYVEARVNLANACLAAGRAEEAVAQLNEALRLQPGFQPALQTMRRARQKQAANGVPQAGGSP